MNRRSFLKSCGMVVAGLAGFGQLGLREETCRYGPDEIIPEKKYLTLIEYHRRLVRREGLLRAEQYGKADIMADMFNPNPLLNDMPFTSL